MEPAWVLAAAAVFNLALAIGANLVRVPHHAVMARMLGFTWRSRRPRVPWRSAMRKFGLLRRTARAGLAGFVEIVGAVGVVALLASLGLGGATLALTFASNDVVQITLDGRRVHDVPSVGFALVSHLASARLDEAFPMTGLPSSRLSGGAACAMLLLSLLFGAVALLTKAVAELCRGFWYAALCLAFPERARAALEDKEGCLRPLLGVEKPEVERQNG